MSLPLEQEEIIDSYAISVDTKQQIKDSLRKLSESDSGWINVHLFVAGFRLFIRGSEPRDAGKLSSDLEITYNSVSHLCKGRDKDKVKRSILRYYFYIKALKGHGYSSGLI